MFNEYMDKAMQHAHYEQIEDGTYFGRIPGFKGVWANKPTEQECREELREVLEDWILLNIADASSCMYGTLIEEKSSQNRSSTSESYVTSLEEAS